MARMILVVDCEDGAMIASLDDFMRDTLRMQVAEDSRTKAGEWLPEISLATMWDADDVGYTEYTLPHVDGLSWNNEVI